MDARQYGALVWLGRRVEVLPRMPVGLVGLSFFTLVHAAIPALLGSRE